MKLRFRATEISSNQLSFFSLFDLDDEEIEPIVENPQECFERVFTSEKKRPEDDYLLSESLHESDEVQFEKHEVKNLLKNQILHKINFAPETDYLYTVSEYNAELDGLVIEWSPEDVSVLYLSALEESLENIRELEIRGKLFLKDDYGNIIVNPVLIAETHWYMSKSFELTCSNNGLDASELRSELKAWLYNSTHQGIIEHTRLNKFKHDNKVLFHSCIENMGWDIFFDEGYLMSDKKLAIRWTDKDIMDVYIKAFNSTLYLFEELVLCDLLTKRNALGFLEINPVFENHLEWIMSEAFSLVGSHLGHNVPQLRKLMAAICKMNLN